jgi:hypothetical protein
MRGRNRKGQNALTRSYESNGGDVKIRGTALHIAEKYVQLSRDAASSGDRVAAEHYLQHAEHYYRILALAQAQMPQPQPIVRSDDDSDVDDDDDGYEAGPNGQAGQGGQYAAGSGEQPSIGPNDPQPYVNGNGNGGANGNGQEQAFDGGQPSENREGRNHRGRRRRPFRDRQGGERASGDEGGGEASSGGAEAAQPMAAEPAGAAGQAAED